jgi:hypothetical protein
LSISLVANEIACCKDSNYNSQLNDMPEGSRTQLYAIELKKALNSARKRWRWSLR